MLRPCASCSRLVRGGDAQCPFCGSAERSETPNKARGHLSRAARIVGAAAIGVACGGTTDPTPSGDSGTDTSAVKDSSVKDAVDEIPIGPMYGGPFDASVADAAADAPVDTGTDTQILPPYGGPPPRSSTVV